MNRLIPAALVAFAFGSSAAAFDPEKAAATEGSMEMQGIDLYMHDTAPTFGGTREPTFWVHAESGRLSPDRSLWSLEVARAVVYRDAEDDLYLSADAGRFDQANQRAYLENGVEATSGGIVVRIDDLEWDNAEKVARSESMAEIRDGTNELQGRPVRIYPSEDRIELGAGSGTIALAQSTAPSEDGEPSGSDRYTAIDVKWQGRFSGNLSGRLNGISEGVHLVVLGKSEADNIDIKANSVDFEYDNEEDAMPARMTFRKDVVFSQVGGTIRANEVVLDLGADTAVFRGDLHVDFDPISGAQPEFIEIDLDSGDIVGGPGPLGVIRITDEPEAEANADR